MNWHLLYWGRYSPQLLLAASTSPTFKEAIQTAFSTMTQTELPRELHLQKLVERAQRAQGLPVAQPVERPARRPLDVSADADRILKRARSCAINYNVHTHSQTCHKGKTGECRCRMCYPEGYVQATVFRHIERAPEGQVTPKFCSLLHAVGLLMTDCAETGIYGIIFHPGSARGMHGLARLQYASLARN